MSKTTGYINEIKERLIRTLQAELPNDKHDRIQEIVDGNFEKIFERLSAPKKKTSYTAEERAKLISTFKFDPLREGVYVLSYTYRKKHSGYHADKVILDDLIKEKLVKVVSKGNNVIEFQYLGE